MAGQTTRPATARLWRSFFWSAAEEVAVLEGEGGFAGVAVDIVTDG